MSTKMMGYFYSPSNGGGTLQQPVPDSLQVSPNNPQFLDASPPSLYGGSSYHHHHHNSTPKPSPLDNKMSELLSFDAFPNENNGHSPLNLPDLTTSPSYSWDDISFHGDTLSSSTAMTMSSGPIDSSCPPMFAQSSSNSFIHPEDNLVNDYLGLDIFDELGAVPSPSTECSSLFPTLPSTPDSAMPLSPEEQEIEDIVTSFETDSPPMQLPQVSIHAVTPSNPSLIDHTSNHDSVNLTVTNSLQSVSSDATPTPSSTLQLSACTPVCTIEPSPNATKPVKKQPRKKMSATKKKDRKKEQNKTAALRYRQKKKEEAQLIDDRQDKLEEKNKELRKEVHDLEKEIKYLKQLWQEVTVARQRMHQ